MEIIRGFRKIRKYPKPVVAIGIFDGVHRAHRHILKMLVRKAKTIRGTSMVFTLFPHPQKEDMLSSLSHRLRLIKALNVDVCVVVNFDEEFSSMPAVGFIKDILIGKIGARYIYVGEDFRFGEKARGDVGTLRKYAAVFGYGLKVFSSLRVNNVCVSSTYIRRLIAGGNLKLAEKLLLRKVSILGKVIKGDSLATKLGFPTANISPQHEVLPPAGVYAVAAFLEAKGYPAICYIGCKPTFAKKIKTSHLKRHVEIHIFDFDDNIYGKELEIRFIRKIRDEKKFISSQSLVEQIKKDILSARRLASLKKTRIFR